MKRDWYLRIQVLVLCVLLGMLACNKIVEEKDYPVQEGTKFHPNYQIDLKQNGYWVLDEYGNEYWIEFGELEEFFLNDNL